MRSLAVRVLSMRFSFDQIGRLPELGDNVAITNRRLEAGTEIEVEDRTFRLPHTILEGHRFAVVPSPREPLLSWGCLSSAARCRAGRLRLQRQNPGGWPNGMSI